MSFFFQEGGTVTQQSNQSTESHIATPMSGGGRGAISGCEGSGSVAVLDETRVPSWFAYYRCFVLTGDFPLNISVSVWLYSMTLDSPLSCMFTPGLRPSCGRYHRAWKKGFLEHQWNAKNYDAIPDGGIFQGRWPLHCETRAEKWWVESLSNPLCRNNQFRSPVCLTRHVPRWKIFSG